MALILIIKSDGVDVDMFYMVKEPEAEQTIRLAAWLYFFAINIIYMETILIDYQIFSWEEQSIIVCTQRCVIYLFRKDFVKTKLYMHVFCTRKYGIK